MNIQGKHWKTAATAFVVSSALLIGVPAVAYAGSQSSAAVTSSRTFKPGNQVRKNLLAESTATQVDSDSNWGGVESLNVPQTKSQAQKDEELRAQEQAKAQQEAQARAQAQAQAEAQAQAQRAAAAQQSAAASRSSSRAPLAASDAPVSGNGQEVLNFATQFLGVPYVWGGISPAGFDCSGFTQYVFAHFGVSLPRLAAQQRVGTPVSNPTTGDLMVSKDGEHVAIYIAGGSMIHAPQPGQSVKIQGIYSPGNWDFYRVL
ncbi:hypothetical protein KIM372_04810 [Bombiscardovia nodaiensis]|uniref:NlpC/P60 domain-containing protein n=1 Tax=Bombiscardovia nodaiensis TaxID=2932181 RepID=A0ABM8B6W2_9BIFI|nr:hypothetical protein KIM372_04810 [Bombiscardovia nodaiensis]